MHKHKRQYYKFHKKYNEQQKIFDPSLFRHADIVLMRISNEIRLYFVQNKHKVGTKNGEPIYNGIIGSFKLPNTFKIPQKSEKISAKKFFEFSGSV
jgi:hypothetical protein